MKLYVGNMSMAILMSLMQPIRKIGSRRARELLLTSKRQSVKKIKCRENRIRRKVIVQR